MEKIIIACDSFKESISAKDACRAIEKSIHASGMRDVETILIPMADGGEGSAEVIGEALGLQPVGVAVQNPFGKDVMSATYHQANGNAVIEIAACCGIAQTPAEKRDPTKMTTFGLGQMILDAIDQGNENIIICLGGSGTNDGGYGMLHALGVTFYDKNNVILPCIIDSIGQIAKMDITKAIENIGSCKIEVASDVENTFTGPMGATHVFGKQKGATPGQIEYLEDSLVSWSKAVKQQFGIDLTTMPRTGAAGGVSGALAILGVPLQSGIKTILDKVDFKNKATGASLIITGEGSVDSQTINGKTISGIATVASELQIPLVVLAGRVTKEASNLYDIGVTAMFSIVNEAMPLQQALENGVDALEQTTTNIMKLWNIIKK